jgi:hypothetical protein
MYVCKYMYMYKKEKVGNDSVTLMGDTLFWIDSIYVSSPPRKYYPV